jgi:hypothetical protein
MGLSTDALGGRVETVLLAFSMPRPESGNFFQEASDGSKDCRLPGPCHRRRDDFPGASPIDVERF